MLIDVRTMLIVMAATNIATCALYWIAFSGRFRDGLSQWALSFGLQGGVWLLYAMRDIAPDFLTVVVANALLIAVWPLQASALLQFQGRTLSRWWLWLPPLMTGIMVWSSLSEFRPRTFVMSVLGTVCAFSLAWLFYRERTAASTRVRWLMTLSTFIAGLLFLVRALGIWFDPQSIVSAHTVSPAQTLVYLVGFVLVLASAFGMLLMHKERADNELVRQATIDALTGAYNRAPFASFAERELARAKREKIPVSLMMLDLDRFKTINDNHGHPAGDQVLRHFANLVNGCLRKGDLLVRYGGEEFCVLLPGTEASGAAILAERIRGEIEAASLSISGAVIRVTTSIGVITDHDNDRTLDSLIYAADNALYRAKAAGRNRVELAERTG